MYRYGYSNNKCSRLGTILINSEIIRFSIFAKTFIKKIPLIFHRENIVLIAVRLQDIWKNTIFSNI